MLRLRSGGSHGHGANNSTEHHVKFGDYAMKRLNCSISTFLILALISLGINFTNCEKPYKYSIEDGPAPIDPPGGDPNRMEHDYTGDWLAIDSLELCGADSTLQLVETTITLSITRKFWDTTPDSVIIGTYQFVRGARITEGKVRKHKIPNYPPKFILCNQQTACHDSLIINFPSLSPWLHPEQLSCVGEYAWYNGEFRYSLGTDCQGVWYLRKDTTLDFERK